MAGVDVEMWVELESLSKFLRNAGGLSDTRDSCLSHQITAVSAETSTMQKAVRPLPEH